MKNYNSIHEYLDEVLSDIDNPSDADIKKAKAEYWKQYLRAYQQRRRSRIQEYTLGFNAEDIKRIHSNRETLSVSEFLYRCVYTVLDGNKIMDTKLLGGVHALQLTICQHLEDLLDNNSVVVSENLLERMEALEQEILKLKSYGN